MTPEENKSIFIKTLRDKGYNDKAIAGWLAVASDETGGTFAADTVQKNGIGKGIFQWGIGQRYDNPNELNLVDYAKRHGKDHNNLVTQLDFSDEEIMNPKSRFYGLKDEINNSPTSGEAAKLITSKYLVTGKPHWDKRIKLASEFESSLSGNITQQVSQPLKKDESDTLSHQDITFDNAYKAYPQTKNIEGIVPKKLTLLADNPTFIPSNAVPINLPEHKNAAGFLPTLFHEASELSEISQTIHHFTDTMDHNLPDNTGDTPEGWTPFEVENFEGYDEKYWPLITHAKSPAQLKAIQDDIRQRMDRDKEYENGSLAAKFIGGVIGLTAGSPTFLIPMSSVLRYGKGSSYILRNLIRSAPGLSASTAAHNLYMESLKTNPDMEKAALDTFRDITFGLVLTGTGLGIGAGFRGYEMYANRKAFDLAKDGIGIKRELTKDGIDTGRMVAYALPNSTTGSKELSEAQKYLDSTLARTGLLALPGATKLFSTFNPIVKGLTNRFPVVRAFMDRSADHSLTTEGQLRGNVRPDNFEEKIWKWRGRTKEFLNELQGLWYESNGIQKGLSPVMAAKALKQRFEGGRKYTYEEFGKEVIGTIISDESHSNKSINVAADKIRKHIDDTYSYFRDAYDLPEEWLSPRTAREYFMRSYNHDALVTKSSHFNDVVSNVLKDQDMTIATTMQPLRDAEARLDHLKAEREVMLNQKGISNEAIKENALNIEKQNREIRNLNDSITDRMAKEEHLKILIDDPNALSATESKELKSLLKTKKEHEAELEKHKKIVSDLKAEISKARSSSNKAKRNVTAQKHKKDIAAKKAELDAAELEMEKFEQLLQDEEDRLYSMAFHGKVNKRFFTKDKDGYIKYKDPNNRLKFRKTFDTHEERIAFAEQNRNVILNHTPDQISDHVLGTFFGANPENPIKSRSLMIPDSELYANGFLHTNLNHVIGAYDSFLTKKGALKEVYSDLSIDGGIEGIINQLTREYNNFDRMLNGLKNENKKIKEKRKLKKDFDDAQELIKNTFNVLMGHNNRSRKTQTVAKIIRDFSGMTRLGAVPLTMVVEPTAIVMKQGLWPSIRDGLVPWLKSVDGMLKTKEGKSYRENAAHALIAHEHILNGYTDKMWNSNSVADVPVGGALGTMSSVIEKLSHTSASLAGTNQIDNMLQRSVANIAQSKIMNYMHRAVKGNITKKQKAALLKAGLDPEKWAKRFVKEWESVGSDTNGLGGYLSHYYNWADTEAANKMAQAIRRETRDTILKRGQLTSPFFTNDPIIGLSFLFKGWGFEAFSRYTLPFMQEPDGQKILGMGLMLAMGATVDPLRRIARGESPLDDDDKMYWAALSNSGVLGVLTDYVEDANIFLGGHLLKKLQNDRYRERSIMGVLGGPAGGIADDFARIASMLYSQNWNTNAMNKLARLIPFANIWETRALTNKFVEGLQLPKTEREAAELNGYN